MKSKSEEGQALVLVLLSLAVVLTIVLFILSRSVTDIAVSSNESQSVTAFSAAEAGVEQALVLNNIGNISSNIGSASYTTQTNSIGGGSTTSFIYPIALNSGDSMTLWLHSQDSSPSFGGNTLKICWGRPDALVGSNDTPAIEASVFYETTANNPSTGKVFRVTADPYSSGRSPANSFTPIPLGSGETIAGEAFPFCTTLNNLNSLGTLQFLTVRMFYNVDTAHPVAFDGGASAFPTQGITIDSTGISGSIGSTGRATRKVEVFQSWPSVPSVFQFGAYSPTGFTE